MQYSNSILSTDVFDFNNLQNIRAIRTLFEILKTRVGSTISYQALSEDIGISPNTVKKYIEILEALFVIFRVTPYSKKISRSLIKEPKLYFFDTGLVKSSDTGAQLENLVAICLLKHVYAQNDYYAKSYTLHYLRTKDGQEVDFALAKEDNIEQIIEVKNSNSEISKSLYYFNKKYNYPAIQIVKDCRNERLIDWIKVMKAVNFLSDLFL